MADVTYKTGLNVAIVRQTDLDTTKIDVDKAAYSDLASEHLYILAINPGSISTKISVFYGSKLVLSKELLHSVQDLAPYDGLPASAQLAMRTGCVTEALCEVGFDETLLDAVSCRGGLLRPIPHGTYAITDAMLAELQEAKWGDNRGCQGEIPSGGICSCIKQQEQLVPPKVLVTRVSQVLLHTP